MKQEDMAVAAIAKEGAAELSDVRRRLHPARCRRIEVAKGLQLSILAFRQNLNPHGGRHIESAVLGLVCLPCLQRVAVVTDTPAALGTLG